ncbi:MAG TPA: hypothetical protein VKF37_16075 [Chloroflexota bacterium]|nr:hypothetical protein [Chloroflexota bacterium]
MVKESRPSPPSPFSLTRERGSPALVVGTPPTAWPMRRWGILLQAATLVPIAVAYLWFTLVVRGAHGFSGDEPHYLAFTQGLWLYHTVDQHRVLYHHDFFAYYARLMSSHAVHRGGHLYALHYPGLPLVLLPGFALGGAAGAQVTTALIGVLVCWRALHVAARVAGPIAAALAVGMLGLSAPLVLNAGAIYPDLLSGLLLVLGYEALDAPRLTARRALALGLVLAVCPWVHVKLLAVMAVYVAWAASMLWRGAQDRFPSPPSGRMQPSHVVGRAAHPTLTGRKGAQRAAPLSRAQREGSGVRAALLVLGLPLISVAGLMCYNRALYGSPSPAAPYEGPTLLTSNPVAGIVGQIFAQGQGALGTAPFALLAVPGAVALWRRERTAALKIGLATVPFWLVTLTYRIWWGGDAPPLRFLLPLLPLWATGFAALLAGLRTVTARLTVCVFAAATLALTVAIPAAPRLGWPLPAGRGGLLLALGEQVGLPLGAWLPAFEPTRTGPGLWHHAPLIALWAAVLLVAWALLAHGERRARMTTL